MRTPEAMTIADAYALAKSGNAGEAEAKEALGLLFAVKNAAGSSPEQVAAADAAIKALEPLAKGKTVEAAQPAAAKPCDRRACASCPGGVSSGPAWATALKTSLCTAPPWAGQLRTALAPAWARTLAGFCPTGKGGGVDNSCGKGGGAGGSSGGGSAASSGGSAKAGVKRLSDLKAERDAMKDIKPMTDPRLDAHEAKVKDALDSLGYGKVPTADELKASPVTEKNYKTFGGKGTLAQKANSGAINKTDFVKAAGFRDQARGVKLDTKWASDEYDSHLLYIIGAAEPFEESVAVVHEDACPCSTGDCAEGGCACSAEHKEKMAAAAATPQAMTGKLWEVVVIETGMSKNARLYPAEVLQKAVPLFEDLNVYAHKFDQELWNHLPEDVRQAYPDGIAGSICGFLENVHYDPDHQSDHQKRQNLKGAIVADLRMVDDRMRGIFKNLHDEGRLDKLGFSIDVEGQVSEGESIQDIPTKRVESIDSAYALDVVTHPAAGGRMRRLKASAKTDPKRGQERP